MANKNNDDNRITGSFTGRTLASIIAVLFVLVLIYWLTPQDGGLKVFRQGGAAQLVTETVDKNGSELLYVFNNERAKFLSSDTVPEYTDPVQIRVLDVGQGLCLLISHNGHYAVYDGGGFNTSSYVVSYMKSKGISKFDYLIASHYDEDHIGGLNGILNTFPVDTIICPNYTADTKTYESFKAYSELSDAEIVHPDYHSVFNMDGINFYILGPVSEHDEENNKSLVILMQYNNFTCLLTGDMEEEAEMDMVQDKSPIRSDVLIVAHHGSASSSSKLFLQRVKAQCAVISVGENDYGHPSRKTLDQLERNNIKTYRTDIQGEIDILTDGTTFWLPAEPVE